MGKITMYKIERKSVILAENNERQRQPVEKHGGTIMRNTITERWVERNTNMERNTKKYKYGKKYVKFSLKMRGYS